MKYTLSVLLAAGIAVVVCNPLFGDDPVNGVSQEQTSSFSDLPGDAPPAAAAYWSRIFRNNKAVTLGSGSNTWIACDTHTGTNCQVKYSSNPNAVIGAADSAGGKLGNYSGNAWGWTLPSINPND